MRAKANRLKITLIPDNSKAVDAALAKIQSGVAELRRTVRRKKAKPVTSKGTSRR